MRRRKLKYNTIANLLNNVVTLVCGFILPKWVLNTYGSEINGLVNSITRFLGFIAFFEFGVGAVVRSGLYVPLANRDNDQISQVVASSDRFFRKIARILLVYIFVLLFLYPVIINNKFGYLYTDILILAISVNMFTQYYFGKTNQILVIADQKAYVFLAIESAAILVNTVACILLMKAGASIHIVKGITSIIFLARPVFLYLYVNKNYSIDRHIRLDKEPLPQKKYGVAQHIANYVLDGTDIMVLTIFSTLSNVSIYNVYYMVINGLRTLVLALSNGMQSLLGELIAKNEKKDLIYTFGWYEWCSHSITTILFGCCSILIVPFVAVYTAGIIDADYYVPTFGGVITISMAIYCLSIPYNTMILASNTYKQTQNYFIFAAIINVISSVVLVNRLGLVGVAIGTLVAVVYQTIWMTVYNSRKLITWPMKNTLKQYGVDVIVFVAGFAVSRLIAKPALNYSSWILMAIMVLCVYFGIWLIMNYLLYRVYIKEVTKKLFLLYGKFRFLFR